MRILFASVNPLVPQFFGVIDSNIDNLSRNLAALGHHVAALVNLKTGDAIALKNRLLRKLAVFAWLTKDALGIRYI